MEIEAPLDELMWMSEIIYVLFFQRQELSF